MLPHRAVCLTSCLISDGWEIGRSAARHRFVLERALFLYSFVDADAALREFGEEGKGVEARFRREHTSTRDFASRQLLSRN